MKEAAYYRNKKLTETHTHTHTITCTISPTSIEGTELTFKLPLTGMVVKCLAKSNEECMKYFFHFYQLLITEVAFGPRMQVNDCVRVVFPGMSLQLIQPS